MITKTKNLFNMKPICFYLILSGIGILTFVIALYIKNLAVQSFLVNIASSFIFAVISIFLIDSFQRTQKLKEGKELHKAIRSQLVRLINISIHSLRDFCNISVKDFEGLKGFSDIAKGHFFNEQAILKINRQLILLMKERLSDKDYFTPKRMKSLSEIFNHNKENFVNFIMKYSQFDTLGPDINSKIIDLAEEKTNFSILQTFPELLDHKIFTDDKGKDLGPILRELIQHKVIEYLVALEDVINLLKVV